MLRTTPNLLTPSRKVANQSNCRFDPIVYLQTGEIVGSASVFRDQHEEMPKFGRQISENESQSAAQWTVNQLRTAAATAGRSCDIARPIHIPAPFAAVADAETPRLCDEFLQRSSFCAQEFVIELNDSALGMIPEMRLERVEAFRRRGFRVGLDARKSFETPLCENLRLLLDSIHIREINLRSNPTLAEQVFAAADSGILVIADEVYYRDADELADHGIHYGVRVRTDA